MPLQRVQRASSQRSAEGETAVVSSAELGRNAGARRGVIAVVPMSSCCCVRTHAVASLRCWNSLAASTLEDARCESEAASAPGSPPALITQQDPIAPARADTRPRISPPGAAAPPRTSSAAVQHIPGRSPLRPPGAHSTACLHHDTSPHTHAHATDTLRRPLASPPWTTRMAPRGRRPTSTMTGWLPN
jgi:hypothetical protein